ncbi:hypothetical protein T459_20249 [Capsicum annuum]|uniref:Uncharacterized protein n=1 Tax=Capsicum annuum TaxID=4072 RepID=A0A2G2Z3X8_CAPAN|nr:hypothetical protein T459_20249 [Capsicum annuum]
MSGEDKEGNSAAIVTFPGESYQLQLSVSRVNKIMKLDQGINRVENGSDGRTMAVEVSGPDGAIFSGGSRND